MSAIAARIFLRWLSGFLVAKGLFAADDASIFADPELEQFVMLAIGTGAGAVAEGWHWLARKYGWSF